MIGDTVVFTSKDPYKLRITGRTKHFINAFGEEIIIDNAERAIKEACAATGAIIDDYTAGPIFMSENQTKGAHQWLIEFNTVPDNLDKFTTILDLELQKLNSDYEAKRHKNATLEKPHVLAVADGTFLQWMRERGKVGGQNKVPRLSNNREFLESLLRINENIALKSKFG